MSIDRKMLLMLAALSVPALADSPAAPHPSVEQIVQKNAEAKGGLDSWRKIGSMIWVGHIETANAPAHELQFVLEMKRPDKTRFEVKAQNRMFVRIFDGARGWKVRPSQVGTPQLQPYSAEELSFARDADGIGGPLIDSKARGLAIRFDGVDQVEGRKAYRLEVRLPSGAIHHVWVDAETFLELEYDRESRNAFGQRGTVAVYYRNYSSIQGLQIPLVIESGTGTAKTPDRMVIDKVLLNPQLSDLAFAKPSIPGRNVASVEIEPQPAARPAEAPFSRWPRRVAPVPGEPR